jgi:hypothetical protein
MLLLLFDSILWAASGVASVSAHIHKILSKRDSRTNTNDSTAAAHTARNLNSGEAQEADFDLLFFEDKNVTKFGKIHLKN